MLAIRGLKIQVYGNKDELFSLWNGGTIKAFTRREGTIDFFNDSEKMETSLRPHKLSESEYRDLPEDIRREHATYLLTEFLKDSTLRRK